VNRLERTSETLVADLSPPHWLERILGASIFSLVLLGLAIGLMLHGQRYHWRCDDPIIVWCLLGTIALCAGWAVREERNRQLLELDRQHLRYVRGWGPFASRLEAPLDEVVFDERDGAVLLIVGKTHVRLGARDPRSRERLLTACRAHQQDHVIRLR
jgi:hypothetical protein